MKPIFLYGTLLYEPLLAVVIGKEVAPRQASLEGYGVFWAGEESYPRIAEAPGETARGILIDAEDAVARLDFYEGGYGYDLIPVSVETDDGPVEAQVYWPGSDVPAPGAPWSLGDWAAKWGAMTCHLAREAMDYFGTITPEELLARMPMMRGRAWSRVLAEAGEATAPLGPLPEAPVEVETLQRPYTKFFSVSEADLSHPKFDGSRTPILNRAAFVACDAIVVLPYDPVRDRVHLIEQFRMGPFFRGDPNCFPIEAVAGRIDAGESAEEACHRELMEEAGLEARSLHLVSQSYPTAGSMTEYLYIYIALTDLPDDAAIIGGVDDEDEDIRATLVDFDRFQHMLDSNALNIGPLIIAAHWLVRHREKLRGLA
ncbi:MAG: gamma-glutamylcyclotransferase [Pseudomonadota bacterium]